MDSIITEVNNYLNNNNNNIIITIDGPTGSGKGTIAKELCEMLHLLNFSMGNVFRSLACQIIEDGIDLNDVEVITKIISNAHISYEYLDGNNNLILNGIDYSLKISNPNIAEVASIIASNSILQTETINLVRKMARDKNILMEGRATGSYVFPESNVKFYLDASLETRVNRKFNKPELDNISKEILKEKINERDSRDKSRSCAPLIFNNDYIYIDSTNLDINQTINYIIEKIYNALLGI